MYELGSSPRPHRLYRRINTQCERPVQIHNDTLNKFNRFYRKQMSLATIPEKPENAHISVVDAKFAKT